MQCSLRRAFIAWVLLFLRKQYEIHDAMALHSQGACQIDGCAAALHRFRNDDGACHTHYGKQGDGGHGNAKAQQQRTFKQFCRHGV